MTRTAEIPPAWFAVDWGTTRLRAWGLSGSDTVLWQGASDAGMGTLATGGFEDALLALIGPVMGPDRVRVIACGMVGSRQGWAEAAYGSVPCPPISATLTRAPCRDPRLDVRIVAGLKQTAPADVMRGEETQIAGFLSLNPRFDGIICLPGTHSKWVHISADEVVSFRTFMTGEMFAALTSASVLRHSVAAEGWDETAFAEAVDEALSRPERLASALFSVRARHLLEGQTGAQARARLSGLLVGAELAAARPYWLGQQVAILGEDTLARAYATALGFQGLSPLLADANRMTLAGLAAAHAQLKEIT